MIGTYFTFKSASEFRQDMHEDLKEFKQDINSLRQEVITKVEKAERILNELSVKAEITITVIKAQNDSRQAFDILSSMSNNLESPFQKLVQDAVIKIRGSYSGFTIPAYVNVIWKDGVDPEKSTFFKLEETYHAIAPMYHASLLNFVWKRKDIPKKD